MMKRKFSAVLLLPLLSLIACEDLVEPTPGVPASITVEFTEAAATLDSDQTDITVSLKFSAATKSGGEVKLSISNPGVLTAENVVNGLATFSVPAGATTAQFKLVRGPQAMDNDQLVAVTLSTASEGLKLGVAKSLSVMVKKQSQQQEPQLTTVSFASFATSTPENNLNGHNVVLNFSAPVATGQVELIFSSEKAVYGTHFTTEPAATNGKLVLNAQAGAALVSFKVLPVHQTTINGDLHISFNVLTVSSGLQLGNISHTSLTIKDFELINKPKGYDQVGGNWSLSKVYEYNEAGQISKVHITQATPIPRMHTETYFYNSAGELIKINQYPGQDVIYTWQHGKIVKAEEVREGIVREYSLYGYDNFGNVNNVAEFHRQADGSFVNSFIYVYLYYLDGNLYKHLTYIPQQGDAEPVLLTSRSYESYLEKENPFPVEILPGKNAQTKLPSSYRFEGQGSNLFYTFTYEFDDDGKITRRYTSGSGQEVVNYLYY